VGRRNLVQFRVGVEENVGKKWKFKEALRASGWPLQTTIFTRAAERYPSPPPGCQPPYRQRSRSGLRIRISIKGLNFGFGYARLFAGQFLKTTTPGHDYSYPYAYVEYNFSKSGFHFPITPNKPN